MTIVILDGKEAQHLKEGLLEPEERSNPGPGSRAQEIPKVVPSFLGGYGTEQKGKGMQRSGKRKKRNRRRRKRGGRKGGGKKSGCNRSKIGRQQGGAQRPAGRPQESS